MARMDYNGVEIPWCTTRSCKSDVTYTEDRADWIGLKHEIYVEGMVHTFAGDKAGDRYTDIRHALEQPRKDLLFTVNGAEIIRSSAALDLANGPHPEVVSIDRVYGSESLHVAFRITTDLLGCPNASRSRPPFLSNRWEERVVIDSAHLSKLTRTGKLILTPSAFGDTDLARSVVTPPIHPFFNRVSAEYCLASDGLSLSYTFVDQEEEADPPAPAIRIDEAHYTESSPDGAKRYGEVVIGLTGRPRPEISAKRALLATAVLMGVRRLQAAGALSGRGDTPVIMTMTEHLHKNRVRVSMRCLLGPVIESTGTDMARSALTWGAGVASAALKLTPWGRVVSFGVGAVGGSKLADAVVGEAKTASPRLPSDLAGWGLPPHGSAEAGIPDMGRFGRPVPILRLLSAALNDPCLGEYVDKADPSPAERDRRDKKLTAPPAKHTTPPPATVKLVDVLPSDGHKVERSLGPAGVYTECHITTRWETDEGVAHLAPTDTTGVSAFVPYSGRTKQLVVEYAIEKVGGRPMTPPTDLGSNYVLLEHAREPVTPDSASDGVTHTARVRGHMIFGVRDPAKVVEAAAVPPWFVEQLRTLRQNQHGSAAADLEKLMLLVCGATGDESADVLPLDAIGRARPRAAQG